jgi:hypothetical protein
MQRYQEREQRRPVAQAAAPQTEDVDH